MRLRNAPMRLCLPSTTASPSSSLGLGWGLHGARSSGRRSILQCAAPLQLSFRRTFIASIRQDKPMSRRPILTSTLRRTKLPRGRPSEVSLPTNTGRSHPEARVTGETSSCREKSAWSVGQHQFRPVDCLVRMKSEPARFRATMFYRTADTKLANIIPEFSRFCKTQTANGLARYAAAASMLPQAYPHAEGILCSDLFYLPPSSAPSPNTVSATTMRINFGPGKHELSLIIPTFRDIKILLKESSLGSYTMTRCLVNLGAVYQPNASSVHSNVDPQHLSAPGQTRILTDITHSVLHRICDKIRFSAPQEVPQTLAEGLLQTLRFPDPDVVLQRVSVQAFFKTGVSDDSFDILAIRETSRKTESSLADPEPNIPRKTAERLDATNNAELEEGSGMASTAGVDMLSSGIRSQNKSSQDGPEADGVAGMSTHVASRPEPEDEDSTTSGRVYIALGSNVGDRLQNIENACRLIDADADMRILRTSALYETAPMYVEDQGRFLNGACEITTTLDPISLLDRLQAMEKTLGREKMIDKGPRNIDLDILTFRNEQIKTERLTIPHALMLEREFVLRPLCNIRTARMRRVPGTQLKTHQALSDLVAKYPPQAMLALTNLGHEGEDIRSPDPRFPTRIMSIVNVTPDSFSDGGYYKPSDLETFRTLVKAQIAAGASIIDVGGQSSRPNAPDVTAEEEIARVVPAIEAIKSLPEAAKVSISVDTYRAAVAEAAVNAGAHIVNDISGGTLDPDMFATVARLGCTYILMHMRGTPATMMSEENCSYPDGLVETVKAELHERIDEAMLAGIRRWRIILDPGLGFSKTVEQNVQLLREFGTLTSGPSMEAYAWLVGSSRKSFIGKVTGVEDPKDRALGTAATVTAAIQGGAHITRVHDAGGMSAVVRMADAIYRA